MKSKIDQGWPQFVEEWEGKIIASIPDGKIRGVMALALIKAYQMGRDRRLAPKTVTREWVDEFIRDKLDFYDTAYDGAMKMLAELGIEVKP